MEKKNQERQDSEIVCTGSKISLSIWERSENQRGGLWNFYNGYCNL